MTMTARPTATRRLTDLPHLSAYISVLFCGAIFGFFYAWVCSTMWGLDATDPRVAIQAMQAMNASVRNPVFFPAFFLTPLVLAATALIARRAGRTRAAALFALAAVVYAVGAMAVTGLANVPLNEDLAAVAVPYSIESAARIWRDYSGRWQLFNTVRTVAGAISLTLVAAGLAALRQGAE